MPSTYYINKNECTLNVHAYQSIDKLTIEYEVKNTSSLTIYLFNRIAKAGGDSIFNIDPNAADILLDDNKVVVSKALLPLPEGKEVEGIYIPCMTHLEPGHLFKEMIALNLPLSPFAWYNGRPVRKNPVQRPLFFELGYAMSSSATDKYIKRITTNYKDEYYAGWFPNEFQQIINTDTIADRVTVYSSR